MFRALIVLHRWIGVALCALFLLWFPSGIGMMYWGMPAVTEQMRIERWPALDPSRIVLSPLQAAERVGGGVPPAEIRLNSYDGRPAYRVGGLVVYADTGDVQGPAPARIRHRAAVAWTGLPVSEASVEPVTEIDQWMVGNELRNLRPLSDGASRLFALDASAVDELDRARIVEIVRALAPDPTRVETRIVTQYDRYYLDRRREQPLPVLLALMEDEEQTRHYIDPKTATVVRTYSGRNAWRRWAYNGLHSFDFPWLYNHRPLWDIVVITFMLGGTGLGVTAVVLAWRAVGKKLRALSS